MSTWCLRVAIIIIIIVIKYLADNRARVCFAGFILCGVVVVLQSHDVTQNRTESRTWLWAGEKFYFHICMRCPLPQWRPHCVVRGVLNDTRARARHRPPPSIARTLATLATAAPRRWSFTCAPSSADKLRHSGLARQAVGCGAEPRHLRPQPLAQLRIYVLLKPQWQTSQKTFVT